MVGDVNPVIMVPIMKKTGAPFSLLVNGGKFDGSL